MKKISSLIVVLFLVFSCVNSNTVETSKVEYNKLKGVEQDNPLITKIKAQYCDEYREIHLFVIDSCEYIGYINNFHQDFLAHKGNCKFCAKRKTK